MRRRIGTVELKSSTTFRCANYECAAWWKEVLCHPQGVELWYSNEGYESVSFGFQGSIVRDNFQSLWCGSRIGKPYDETQNAGKPAEHIVSCYAYNLLGLLHNDQYRIVLDPDVTVTATVKVLGERDAGWAHTAIFADIAFPKAA